MGACSAYAPSLLEPESEAVLLAVGIAVLCAENALRAPPALIGSHLDERNDWLWVASVAHSEAWCRHGSRLASPASPGREFRGEPSSSTSWGDRWQVVLVTQVQLVSSAGLHLRGDGRV
jgi:hypothetical protein